MALFGLTVLIVPSVVLTKPAAALANTWGTLRATHSNKCVDNPWGGAGASITALAVIIRIISSRTLSQSAPGSTRFEMSGRTICVVATISNNATLAYPYQRLDATVAKFERGGEPGWTTSGHQYVDMCGQRQRRPASGGVLKRPVREQATPKVS